MQRFDSSSYDSSLASAAAAQQLNVVDSTAYRSRAESQLESQNTPTRVFAPGAEITDGMLESLALSPEQLRLERNLIFRDANPNAFFKDPNLEAAINQITGTRGDPIDPANEATKIDLFGSNLENALRLAKYEATARIESWRADNPNLMSDMSIPARLTDEQIASVSPTRIQDAINDVYARNGFPFSGSTNQKLYRQMRDYHPNPRFSEADITGDERIYFDRLIARRTELKAWR